MPRHEATPRWVRRARRILRGHAPTGDPGSRKPGPRQSFPDACSWGNLWLASTAAGRGPRLLALCRGPMKDQPLPAVAGAARGDRTCALLAGGERVIRVAPSLTGASRKTSRVAGKSDPIDATAVARGAIRDRGGELPGRVPGRAGDGDPGAVRGPRPAHLQADAADQPAALASRHDRPGDRSAAAARLPQGTAGPRAPVRDSSRGCHTPAAARRPRDPHHRALRAKTDPETRAYLGRKHTEGKTKLEAIVDGHAGW